MKAQVKVAWVGLLRATSPLINDQTKLTLFPKISARGQIYRENAWPETTLTELVAILQIERIQGRIQAAKCILGGAIFPGIKSMFLIEYEPRTSP
jgi:hypothetical protein